MTRDYVRRTAADRLWNRAVGVENYSSDARRAYQDAVLEQYKLYVEMADRVSARRSLANTFFLTLNALVVTAFGLLWRDKPQADPLWLLLPLTAALGQCAAWFFIVRSYRQLNAGKYEVVGHFEQALPAFPYSRAEWLLLGEGKDWHLYLPFTHVERWIPVLFSILYFSGYLVAILG